MEGLRTVFLQRNLPQHNFRQLSEQESTTRPELRRVRVRVHEGAGLPDLPCSPPSRGDQPQTPVTRTDHQESQPGRPAGRSETLKVRMKSKRELRNDLKVRLSEDPGELGSCGVVSRQVVEGIQDLGHQLDVVVAHRL